MVHFSNNVPTSDHRALCRTLAMSECNHSSIYLGTSFFQMGSRTETFRGITEKLETRLVGWKQKTISLTGRTVLIKTVAMALPSYIMQTFILPMHLCDKMDQLIQGFWWGFGNQRRGLCLCSWDLICTPKLAGWLGIRRMRDINLAFVTKLGWNLCKQPSKIWVQLIQSKYLRGWKIINFRHTVKSSSWIWAGICKTQDSLWRGLCIKVGRNSISHIRDDPWLPGLPNCSLPSEVELNDHLFYVRDLMSPDGLSWNAATVFANFPCCPRLDS